MNLLSGLEKFGLDQMDTDHLFEEEKSDTPARKAPEPVPKKEPVHSETEFLLDKSIRCPVCFPYKNGKNWTGKAHGTGF